ncbi:MAG TPA: heparinase II/III family protein [Candidatus Kapabacteria bacterium]|nr:heparinase II/III family protein [Candidatus Kapabacteria bacterium]
MNSSSAAPAVIALNDVIADVRRRPPTAYRSIAGPERGESSIQALADATMTEGWRFQSQPPVRLVPGLDWDEVCASNRSWAFQLHAWDALEAVLGTFDLTGEGRYLDYAVGVALDWARHYGEATIGGESFAWYDMAIGLRAARLAYLVDRACRSERYDLPYLATLVASVNTHRAVLADDRRFAAHSNHGLYFAAGQLILADTFEWLPGMAASAAQARERLLRMVRTQFTADGVHAEHSPDYHRMVHGTLVRLMTTGALHDDELEELIVRADRVLAWFVLPNGRIAMLGDSPGRIIDRAYAERALSDEARFIYSRGAIGTPPASTVAVFERGGYAIVRGPWRRADEWERCCCLVVSAAFHSRVHKHADDQSVLWFDRGSEILIDPGRFGYLGKSIVGSAEWLAGFWYTDPRRVYVESTRAHNCLQIDGRDYARRGVTPYGSAIRRRAGSGRVTAIESSVRHWESILHTRLVVVHPGEWLLVIDRFEDEAGAPHDLDQRFHFAPELEPLVDGDGLRVGIGPDTVYVVEFGGSEVLAPVRGVVEPQLLGWIAREDGTMEPCTATGFHRAAVSHHRFVTLFRFAGSRPDELRVDETGDDLAIRWHDDVRHRLALHGALSGDALSIEYTIDDASTPKES